MSAFLQVPCHELNCSRCCNHSNAKSGPTLGEEEVPLFEGLVEREADGRPKIKKCKGSGTCTQLQEHKCVLHESKPFICRTYPLMLSKGSLILSLRCPWVSTVLIPKWSAEGMSEEEKETFSRLKKVMLEEAPKTLTEAWDKDTENFEFVMHILPGALSS